jgi:hypothetical protein
MPEKPVAVLTIKNAEGMALDLKKEIADWLRMLAKDFPNPKNSYSKVFRAKFYR